MGDTQTSKSLLQQDSDACNNPPQVMQFASRLLDKGISTEVAKNLYMSLKDRFIDPKDQLSWASDIVQVFKDQD